VETISKLKSDLTELRKIVAELDEAANALAALVGQEEYWPLDEIARHVAPRSVLTPGECEVGLSDQEQPAPEGSYRKNGANGHLPSLAEPISDSSEGLIAAQTLGSSPPDAQQTSDGALPPAIPPTPHQIERRPEPSDQEIRLRAYFLSERRRKFALSGDAESDWHEAKRQLLCESGEQGEFSTITAGDSSRIRRALGGVAVAATVASAKPQVESIEQGKNIPYETSSADIQPSAPEPTSNFPNDVSAEPVLPQTTTLPTIPNTTQIPTTQSGKSRSGIMTKTPPDCATGTSLQVMFSCEITAVQLTPIFEMEALTVRPASRLVTMHLALQPHSQTTENLQVSFETAKIQSVGGTLGTLRMLPSAQQRPVANDSPSLEAAGLQFVSNFEAALLQLTPSQPAQATVFVTAPCEISMVEFSPLFEIASVILNSSSKRVSVQLPGTRLSREGEARLFEIANLDLTESGQISTMQLKLLGPVDASVP
jgi:hypothetical protein